MFNIIDINQKVVHHSVMGKKQEIGEKIKRRRLQLNLRMDDLAKEVGITRSTLWSVENGKGNYSINTLIKLLSFLGLSFEVETFETDSDRRRASRSSSLDNEINRFIVMCVEQYASFVNKSSRKTYDLLEKEGIIKELTDDYEDMHGMSIYSINEYITKRLTGREK